MSSHFAKSYRAASEEVLELFADKELRESKKPCAATISREPTVLGVRKEVTAIGLRTMEAVA
jgi:hypothetical protein